MKRHQLTIEITSEDMDVEGAKAWFDQALDKGAVGTVGVRPDLETLTCKEVEESLCGKYVLILESAGWSNTYGNWNHPNYPHRLFLVDRYSAHGKNRWSHHHTDVEEDGIKTVHLLSGESVETLRALLEKIKEFEVIPEEKLSVTEAASADVQSA